MGCGDILPLGLSPGDTTEMRVLEQLTLPLGVTSVPRGAIALYKFIDIAVAEQCWGTVPLDPPTQHRQQDARKLVN